jgi:DNA-binding NarL/FixJ family response regulator
MLVEDHIASRQALAFLLSHKPDLEGRLDVAVVDLGLPDGDGRELFAELRRSNPGVSVVVLSATIEAGHVEEVLRAGADAVLDKVEAPLIIAEEVRRLAGR